MRRPTVVPVLKVARLLSASCFAIALLPQPMLDVRAQSKTEPRFDVSTIKPNADGDYRVYVGAPGGGRFSATGITLRLLMRYAYDVQDLQITGGGKWIGTERWNVEAKSEAITGAIPADLQLRMMRALLAERFQLKVHSEKGKQMPAYALVIAKNGSRLKKHIGEDGPSVNIGPGHMNFTKSRLTSLTAQLTRLLGRQVFDQTKLSDECDFALEWTPEPGEGSMIPGQPGPAPDAEGIDRNGPSIFTALEEQLG